MHMILLPIIKYKAFNKILKDRKGKLK